eukprot:TRINITY_DN11246_c0_g1_i1.p2 TRINITY_DN11246_c0_g1~~TRINITY_DN11246_c0_g1_i1.p2  ORF type:complete len:110 (+),score=35.82 TRINITY_DN11246_c0_g1_i1:173-502(+)
MKELEEDGYNVVAQEKGVRTLDMVDMFFINSHAELPEMLQAYSPQAVKDRKAFQAPLLDRKAKVPALASAKSSAASNKDWLSAAGPRNSRDAIVRGETHLPLGRALHAG